MLVLGTVAPEFKLPDTTGEQVALADCSDKAALLVMFICYHCRFVKHVRSEFAAWERLFRRGIEAINANAWLIIQRIVQQ